MFSLFFAFLTVLLAVPVFFLLLQVLAAVFFNKLNSTDATNAVKNDSISDFVILMPAHNEELVIAKAIQSILPQLSSVNQLLVIADNCSDNTAVIAKELGAKVIERSDTNRRGKGYALDFGLQSLKDNPPQVVIIVDADCIVSLGTIEKLVKACMYHQRPIQALYLMESQPNPSLKARVASFAWMVKNKVRPLGSKVIKVPCQLMGTGMAFMWNDIVKSNLASGHIVEDMKLGVDMTRLNKAPIFLEDALVTSVFPPSQEATNTQRVRWEHGHLSVILTESPSLLIEAIKTKNIQMLGMTLDLIVPPLAMLTMMNVILFVICYLLSIQPAVFIVFLSIIALSISILFAWFKFGRDIISFHQLCYAPLYAITKLPLYIKFFLNRQVEWVRSKRD
jgi:cellulose synthase/poly-beta-1,6-N-acetylglucosamine synthase-like glycosyltransferase